MIEKIKDVGKGYGKVIH